MTESFVKLCEKYNLSEEASEEFKKLYEDEICKAFFSKINVLNDSKKTTKKKESSEEEEEEKISNPGDLCSAIKKDGNNCTFKAKENGLCGRHLIKEPKAPKINKKPNCSYDGCSSFGTFKTQNGFMCKRHSAE